MKRYLCIISAVLFFTQTSYAAKGMINVKSNHNVQMTAEKLMGALQDKGMTIFQHVQHSNAAKNVEIDLRDTELVIFGNPKVGSLFMQCAQSIAIDLPQKALIWEDEEGAVWLSYNDMDYLAKRHNMEGCEKPLGKVKNVLANFAKAATE